MCKRFFSAIILVFAFLFLNFNLSTINISAEETLPEEIMANAGRGEKYWAVVNYGADYISSKQIIIDIQKEAIADTEVQYIGIAETEHASDAIWYQRNVHLEFSSRINYVLQNEAYGEKYITIFLLRNLELNQPETSIVDKIFVGINQKRNISILDPEDFLITREYEDDIKTQYPYNVSITLDPTKIIGEVNDYVLDSVKYVLLQDESLQTLGAVKVENNVFQFKVYRNGTYKITVKDIFGYTKELFVDITNLLDPPIEIKTIIDEENIGPVNHEYIVKVRVYYYDTEDMLSGSELKILSYEFEGVTDERLKDSMQFTVRKNGVYTIYAETHNGSKADFILVIDNIDMEDPFVQVLKEMTVYTEGLDFFNPSAEIFVYDNVSQGTDIRVELNYYGARKVNGTIDMDMNPITNKVTAEEKLQDAKAYLYTVRDMVIRYTVTDEAGNSVWVDSYVHVIDDTKPTIEFSSTIMTLYINDPYPTAEEVERAYGLKAYDNSCMYSNDCDARMEYVLDFSDLPVDSNNRLNRLGKSFRIFVRAKDESGNRSDEIILDAEVVQRLVTVVADPHQYIVYGDPMVPITYHCKTRLGEMVDCRDELLAGDSVSGELYVLDAYYSGRYEILSTISIPSDFYSLKIEVTEDNKWFTIKQRTIQVVAEHKQKEYLDPDPELTYYIGDICHYNEEDPLYEVYKDYRCSLLSGDKFINELVRYEGAPGEGVWSEGTTKEDVWYDAETRLKVLPRPITQGYLSIFEKYNGSKEFSSNYIIDFVNADFMIYPKDVKVYIAAQEKIYGEPDPVFTLRGCSGKPPIDTYGPEGCMQELRIELQRVPGETVKLDPSGENYMDYYEITGTYGNKNYVVTEGSFYSAYLTILKRKIDISVVGDLDADFNPTGKYTIYYEDDIPQVEVYDSSTLPQTGLVRSDALNIADTFKYGVAEIYDTNDTIISDYVSGIGLYKIKQGTITIVDKDGIEAEYNYDVNFNEGILEVIQKFIWIKIEKELSKIYGESDPLFTEDDLEPYGDHFILEARNKFIIEITPTTLSGGEPYIPRDHEDMKYYLTREEGINVGSYKISIEGTEGCENYIVNLYDVYYFKIDQRPLFIDIKSQEVVYKGTPAPFEYSYCESYTVDASGNEVCIPPQVGLPYGDTVIGEPEVEPYRYVGTYDINVGTIEVVNTNGENVNRNYSITVKKGTLRVYQREVTITVPTGQSKEYGDNTPVLDFVVTYNGVVETMDPEDYTGSFTYEGGEEPCNDCSVDEYGIYPVAIGNFALTNKGKDDLGNAIPNYIVNYDLANTYFYIYKREITISARDMSVFYGVDFTSRLQIDTSGKLANNPNLRIDGEIIVDEQLGSAEVLGNPVAVGSYIINVSSIKIVRSKTKEDVTNKYYKVTYENGILEIVPRELIVRPDTGQSKLYGDSDPVEGITFTCMAQTLSGSRIPCAEAFGDNDKFVGGLQRKAELNVNGISTTEDALSYGIEKGTLKVETTYADGSARYDNYKISLDGSVKYVITKRTLHVKANDIVIDYGDDLIVDCVDLQPGKECGLTYTMSGDGLANNDQLEIYDKLEGLLNLDRLYTGHGTYEILGDNLVLSNKHNYVYTFAKGLLIVNKRILKITPTPESLSKIYGEMEEPILFTHDFPEEIPYSGQLLREEGEDVRLYEVSLGTLTFQDDFEVRFAEPPYYFEIKPREIEITAENSGKIYGTVDPVLKYSLTRGMLVRNDEFFGMVGREKGEDVGTYIINRANSNLVIRDSETHILKTENYDITFIEAFFEIKYAEITSIYIDTRTNNQYQVLGAQEDVVLYAEFNEGANQTYTSEIQWSVTRVMGDGSRTNVEFTRDAKNDITFYPGCNNPAIFEITASYGGITGRYEVVVEATTTGNVYISYVSGETKQTLGQESEVVYKVIVPPQTSENARVSWLINDVTIETNYIKDRLEFYYTPNLGIGEYKIQAKIGNKISEPYYIYVYNNNPPVITLNGQSVVYVEAKIETYKEEYATVWDDIDGDITYKLVITGEVNSEVIGKYYVRYDAIDSHGNRAISAYRQVFVVDTTPPVITLRGNETVTILYGEEYTEEKYGGATAYDVYDGEVPVRVTNNIIMDEVGEYEVIYTAEDEAKNQTTAIRKVIIIDNVSPVLTLIGPSIMHVEVKTKFEDPGATVYDNAEGEFPIEGTSFYKVIRENGQLKEEQLIDFIDTNVMGEYKVRYDYTDASGNPGVGVERTVFVEDTTAPIIKLNGLNPYVIRYAYPEVNYVEPGAVATDNYDEFVEVKISGTVYSELGSYYITYNAVDSSGNSAETVVREVVVVDLESPIIHFDKCPQEITIEAFIEKYDTKCDMPGWGLYIDDNYHADLEELMKRVVVRGKVDDTTIGTYVISYDIVDMSGNAAITMNRYVTVVDTTAPTITLEGGNEIVVEVFEPFVDPGVSVKDLYDDYHKQQINFSSYNNININKLGTYYITYNAMDNQGNKSVPVTRIVHVRDTKPPVIVFEGPDYVVIERGTSYQDGRVTAYDLYDKSVNEHSVKHTPFPTGMHLGIFTIEYTAVDGSGNVGRATKTVEVVDTIDPIVLGVENGKFYRDPVSIHFIPTPGTNEVLTGTLNGKPFESGTMVDEDGEYTLKVWDDADNTITIWFVIDRIAPIILGVTNGEYTNREVVELTTNEKHIAYFDYRYESGEWIRVEDTQMAVTNEGTYRVYVVDKAGNESIVYKFVVDRTKPVYTLTGVENKGITNTNVTLSVEPEASVVINNMQQVPTVTTFTEDGYYQVTLRDLAGNIVNLQFVINKTNQVVVNNKIITIITQHNAIDKVSIQGQDYPRNSGYMLVIPIIEGGFTYVKGKLFSEEEYQTLMAGKAVEFGVSDTGDTSMFVAFVVEAEELNKFDTQTVDDPEQEDNTALYIAMIIVILGLFLFFFLFFIKRRKREEDEEDVEETMYDDY